MQCTSFVAYRAVQSALTGTDQVYDNLVMQTQSLSMQVDACFRGQGSFTGAYGRSPTAPGNSSRASS